MPFWSFQSGSYERRPNWIVPLHAGFSQQNYLGMNASDYGGGTPIVDVWRKDVGIAVGDVEPRPRLISLPVSMPNSRQARFSVQYRHDQTLKPGGSFHTFRTFVAVHEGDYFETLLTYRRFMLKQGFEMAKAPDDAFGAIWCAWGYGRNFKPQQVYDTLPTVKRMGFTWVTLDDGWQNNYGDWQLDPKKFPRGDADIKAMVDRIHQEGFKAQLWWSPLSAVPESKLLTDEPDLALLNRDGSRRKISWWNSDYLCPANSRVVEYHKELVRKILVDWGFDGLKLDGQHMNESLNVITQPTTTRARRIRLRPCPSSSVRSMTPHKKLNRERWWNFAHAAPPILFSRCHISICRSLRIQAVLFRCARRARRSKA